MPFEQNPAQPYDAASPKEIDRNFRLIVLNGVLYLSAETLMDPTLVLVAFMSQLTSSPLLLGLLVPIRDGAWALPQLWISNFIQRQNLKMRFYSKVSYIRILTWIMISATIFFVQDESLLLVFFFIAYIISSLVTGLSGLPFLEMVSKTIPPDRRGELFAWRLGFGGMLGIGGSILVRYLISPNSPFEFPYNYGVLSLIFCVVATIALILLNHIHEVPDEYIPPKRKFGDQVRIATAEFRSNRSFRLLLISQGLMLTAGAAIPFFAVYLQQRLGGSSEWVGIYLAVMMASNLFSNILFGRISRKLSNQTVYLTATIAGTLMTTIVLVLALVAEPLKISPLTASICLLPVYFLAGMRGTGMSVGTNSLLLNIAPPHERSVIIGFSQSLLGIVLLATGLNGVAVELFGFKVLVVITLVAHLAAAFCSTKIVDIRGSKPG